MRYLRFGEPPRKLRSIDGSTRTYLAGVSCYEGWLEEEDEKFVEEFTIDTTGLDLEQGIGALIYMAALDRPAFFVAGEEVGEGPDGEPLVAIDRWWPVPKTTDVTCNETYARSALDLWSRGPRDGSGARVIKARLDYPEAGYLPPGWLPGTFSKSRGVINAIRGKNTTDKKKSKQAKASRKKNRSR